MKKNVMIILISVLSVLVVGLGVFIVYDKVINKDNRENLNEDTENSEGKYSNYEFKNINLLSKDYIYPKKEWIDYQEEKEINIQRDNCAGSVHYKFTIKDGKLTVRDMLAQFPEDYTFQNIINVKAIMEYNNGQDCGSMDIVVLTTDGKIYYRNSYDYMTETQSLQLNYSTLESEFRLLETNYLFDKIGYSTYYVLGSRALGALTTDGKQVTISTNNDSISSPYSSNIYSYLSSRYGQTLNIDYNGKIYFEENKYITDQNNALIYINNGFYGDDAIYIIDREGYLYQIKSDNSTTVAIKYSNSKVVSYGYDTSNPYASNIVLIFKDKKEVEFSKRLMFNL